MIGDEIVVTVVDIRGDKVRLGIDAPQDVPVHRQEVYEAIQRENRRASQVRGSNTIRGKASRLDASALLDPLVRGIDPVAVR